MNNGRTVASRSIRCGLGVLIALSGLAWLGQAWAQATNSAVVPVARKANWWVKRDDAMNARVKQGHVDLIFVGDSITQGWEGPGRKVWAKYYGDRNAVNLGIGGDETQHVLWRLEHGNLEGIHPKLAIVMIGTNNYMANTAEQIGAGITAVVKELRTRLPKTKVLLLAVFPRGAKPSPVREKLAKASAIASMTADGKNVIYMDIGREFLEPDGTLSKSIMPDLLHPNARGYAIWAAAIEPEVAKLMGEIAPDRPPKGFVSLFNGKDLDGWQGLTTVPRGADNPEVRAKMTPDELAKSQALADQSMHKHWKVVNGVIAYDGKGDSLCTDRDYENFEMLVDWKIGPGGDSGIYLRGSPQVQIWDPYTNPAKQSIGSGGLYNNQIHRSTPLVTADHPIGQWNTFRIKMIGDRVTVWLNNKLVTDNVIMENYWDRKIPIFPFGQIQLQNHTSPLWFKNIFIRELPPHKGWQTLFNGKNLDGWKQVGGKQAAWHVENGILYTTGVGGGWLSSTKQYGDFDLDLEFRVPPNGNSGVMIRAPHEGNPSYQGSEIQILDDYGSDYKTLEPWQYCGSLYHTVAPSLRASRHAGQWQKMQIQALGPKVTVALNGIPIVDANCDDFPGMLKNHPGLKRRSGYIGLQTHTDRVEFRNIRIRELNPDGTPKLVK